jgi:flagellar biosynthesis regulator FlbT
MNRNEIIPARDIRVNDSVFSPRFGLNGRVLAVNTSSTLVFLNMIRFQHDTVLRADDTVTLTNRPE